MPYHSIFSYSTSNLFLSSSHASGVRGRPQQGQYSHGIQSFCASHVVHALGCHPKFRQATQVFLPHSVHPGHTRSICSCVGGVRAVRAISAISFLLRYRMSFSPGLLPNPLSSTTRAAVSCFSKRVIASSRVIFIRPFTLFFFILSIYLVIVKCYFE